MRSGSMQWGLVSNRRIVLITVLTAIFFLILSAAATPFPAAIKGTVVEVDERNQTLTMLASCDEHECLNFLACGDDYCPEPAEGLFQGSVPDPAVLTILRPGDSIEATYKRWYMDSYGEASPEPHQIYQWYAISRISRDPSTNEWRATDIFGDPDYLFTPLAHGYRVSYNITPLCSDPFQDFTCHQTTFVLIVEKNGEQIVEEILIPANNFEYHDPDGSSINVTLIKGEWSFIPSKACPCTNLIIGIWPYPRNDAANPVPSPPIPFSSVICLAALVLCGAGWILKYGRNKGE